VLFFAVGFMEELCFRGYAMHNLAVWGGLRFAIAVQAVVFALVHLGNVLGKATEEGAQATNAGVATSPSLVNALMDTRVAMLNITLIGVFFALSYIKTGSLWFPIGFHAAWNFFLGCIWSMPVSGVGTFRVLDVSISSNALLTGGDFGAEGSILLTPLLLVLLWVVWQEADHPQALADLAESRAAPESHTASKPAAVAPVASTATTDVTATAPVANGATNVAPSAPLSSSVDTASSSPPSASDELSVYQVDVTESSRTVTLPSAAPLPGSAPIIAPEVVAENSSVLPTTSQAQFPPDRQPQGESASATLIPVPQESVPLTEAAPSEASSPASPLPTAASPDTTPPATTSQTSGPPTPSTKKPRPRW
jgi:membrane protease YdiL (CAAX protease family)